MASLLADGLNLGLTRMAEACTIASLGQLAWVADWHIRDETYALALRRLVDRQQRERSRMQRGNSVPEKALETSHGHVIARIRPLKGRQLQGGRQSRQIAREPQGISMNLKSLLAAGLTLSLLEFAAALVVRVATSGCDPMR